MKDKIKRIINIKQEDGTINKKKLVIIVIGIITIMPISYTFARYAYTEIKNYFLKTKNFYFNCDKLSESGSVIEMTNWSGVGSYTITFNMNSLSNSILKTNEDIAYNIEYSCSNNVVCSIENNKTNGTISANTNTDSFTIVITVPTETILHDKDRVELNVKTTSTSPYTKELTGVFRLVVGYYGLTHEIDDSANNPYLNTRITNTLDYYVVRQAFDSYSVGNQIDEATYNALSNTNKAKCASSIVTLTFDPAKVLLDMTSEIYQNATSISRTTVNGHEYISSISFKIDAMSSKLIKFYKVNASLDYTYPNNNDASIITVTYS